MYVIIEKQEKLSPNYPKIFLISGALAYGRKIGNVGLIFSSIIIDWLSHVLINFVHFFSF